MTRIARLRRSDRRPDRVIVTLDDAPALSIPLDLAIGLRPDQALDERELAALRSEADYRRALDRVLRFLGYRPRSLAEIESYMAGKAVTPATRERVTRRLTELALIDDRAFARWWVEDRCRHRPRSRRALAFELTRKGVAPGIAAEAVSQVSDEDAALEAAAPRAARLRHQDADLALRRLTAFLQRRGFDVATSLAAARATLARSVGEGDGE